MSNRPITRSSAWRRRGNRRANAIIEMAIVLQTLMWLAMGMAEFGQYFTIRNAFQGAARDVARASIIPTAIATDPVTTATRTLGYSGVTFNSSWMTIVDVTTTPTTVTDVSQVPAGHALQFTIQTTYTALPNVYRPLNQITGQGIKTGKLVVGQCTMVRE